MTGVDDDSDKSRNVQCILRDRPYCVQDFFKVMVIQKTKLTLDQKFLDGKYIIFLLIDSGTASISVELARLMVTILPPFPGPWKLLSRVCALHLTVRIHKPNTADIYSHGQLRPEGVLSPRVHVRVHQ